ncbi:cell surface protein [Myroides phaeus]|uniref:cell surface protein n=2 Tax=Myroides TaxID=76831 RepID=UPI001303103C|nr:cell surface protein [Myroides phaeus]
MKKKYLRLSSLAAICLGGLFFFSCSNDDGTPFTVAPEKPVIPVESSDLKLSGEYATDRSQSIAIIPNLEKFTSPKVTWKVIGFNNIAKDSVISNDNDLYFVTLKEGRYNLIVQVQDDNNQITHSFDIKIEKEKEAYKNHIFKIYDFLPSYGQFTNKLPKYEEGDTKEIMIEKAEKAIAVPKPSMISLGGFGGYVVFGFDHTVVNVPGKRDFRVLGNAFWANANPNAGASGRGGSCEPGVIMVAYDKNGNGVPDEDEWYEIAGSEHSKPKTVKDYEITFYRPEANKEPVKDPALTWATDLEYMRWEDNQGNKGYKPKNTFHQQSYFPEWVKDDKITFKGTLLPNNAIDESGQGNYWVLYSFDYGYADNAPNKDDESAIDISWAVDKDGKKVNLPGIDFIKVYTGLNQEAGWLGETSTEVSGAIDLHLEGTSIPTR